MALPRWVTAPAGAVARGVGRTYDYATPGAGTSTLTQAGRAISDPNVVYTGSLNPIKAVSQLGGQSSFVPVNQGGGGQVMGAHSEPPGGYVGDGGGGGGQTYSYGGRTYSSQADAQAAKEAEEKAKRQANIRRNIGVSQGAYEAGGNQNLTDVGNTYESQIRDFLGRIGNAQEDVNTSRVRNALNLRRSMQNIVSGIRQGLRSAGVTLAGMNAGDSGATEAAARAYARVGNQQAGDATGEATLKAGEIDTSQARLDQEREEGQRGFNVYRDTEVGRVRSDLSSKLSALDAEAAAEDVTGAVDMGLVERVISRAVGRLAQIDAMKNQRLAGITGITPEEMNRRAYEMDLAGADAGNVFDVEGPDMEVTGGNPLGAPITQLPSIFKRRNERAVA